MSPYDPAKHVWVIDDNQHQIFKFTYDGKLVHTHGVRGEAGRGPNNFSRPTDIAWLPDGTYFISDGYVGVRVAKFDPNGKFLMDWGTKPVDPAKPGPNEFNTVHSVAVSKDRRVVVADRGHKRFQIFDENGKFLDQFPTGTYSSPYYHLITADQNIWVADGGTDQIVKYDLKGNFQYRWGSPGGQSGQLLGPHQLTIDQEGNLYAAEVYAGRVQKFRPKPKADPAKVVGQEVRLSSSN
jgi:peptidylamidoglycolate lyase